MMYGLKWENIMSMLNEINVCMFSFIYQGVGKVVIMNKASKGFNETKTSTLQESEKKPPVGTSLKSVSC